MVEIKHYKKLKKDSFIQGWIIPENVCDNLLNFFKENKKLTVDGKTQRIDQKEPEVDIKVKDSSDLIIHKDNFNNPFLEYRNYLQKCLDSYIKIYPDVNEYQRFNINENINIQYYKPGGGFKIWHFESCSKTSSNRILVFMTYLNNVKKAGTEFKYQNLKTEAIKGLTLIWPSHFTHTHRGIINNKKEKYIITGWYSYT